jgi:hypothetical protein
MVNGRDDRRVLAQVDGGWYPDASVLGLGRLCQRVELCHWAAECVMPVRLSFEAVNPLSQSGSHRIRFEDHSDLRLRIWIPDVRPYAGFAIRAVRRTTFAAADGWTPRMRDPDRY